MKRPGLIALPAVRCGAVHEIKSRLILQPGPAALTDGLAAMEAIIRDSTAGPLTMRGSRRVSAENV